MHGKALYKGYESFRQRGSKVFELEIESFCLKQRIPLCKRGIESSVPRFGNYLGKHSKPVSTIILPKSPSLLGNFSKGVKIIRFSSEIIFGQLLQTFGDFFMVTLIDRIFHYHSPFENKTFKTFHKGMHPLMFSTKLL